MRILVTGGAGFIGSNLVRKLVHLGHDVLNLDALTYAGNLHSLVDVAKQPNYWFIQADLVDGAVIEQIVAGFRPDAVAHLAAESHVDRSIDSPWQFIQSNVVGTYQLLQATLKYFLTLDSNARERFRFLHVSTDEVYGTLGDEGQFTEASPYDPHSPYSASKAASDHLVRAWYATYGLPIVVTNCSNNYGPFQFPEKLVPTVILSCLQKQPIPVYGDGGQIRDWLYVDDHCEALVMVLKCGQVGQTYNVGGNCPRRNLEVIEHLCRLVDELEPHGHGAPPSSSRITFVSDRPGHDYRYAIDASRIREELGWFPSQDFESGFRRTVQWYLDNRPWWQAIQSRAYRRTDLGIGVT